VTRNRARKKAIRARAAAADEPYSVAARRLGTAGPASDAAASEIATCASTTLAEPSARIALSQDWRTTHPNRGGRRPIRRLARLVVKAVMERAAPGLELGHMAGEGFLEPANGRYMLDYGSYAELCAEGRIFGGLSGRSMQGLHPFPARERPPGDVLWLLRMLPDASDAHPEGAEPVRGTSCWRFAVRVNAAEATGTSGGRRRIRAAGTVGGPPTLALTVWTDGEHIRRIRFEERASTGPPPGPTSLSVSRQLTLDLWDFGVSVEELDWSRLPSFMTPAAG
jgi:hypothetical protein